MKLWGALWRNSTYELDLIYSSGLPLLFRTRAEARAWILKNYGYIKTRKDLREPPHNWRVPLAVRVKVETY